jgi:hypothetical protein
MSEDREGFARRFRSLDDEVLEAVLRALPGEYEEEAVAAAEQELQSRGISEERRAELSRASDRVRAVESERQDAPLPTGLKVLCALGGLPGVLIALRQERHGERRTREAWLAMVGGCLVYLALLVLVFIVVALVGD